VLGPTREDRRREFRATMVVLWFSVLIFAILSGVLLTYQAWAFWAGDKEDAVVPDIAGVPYDDAAVVVEEAGLLLRIRNEAYSDDSNTDIIMAQLPAPGARVKMGREVFVDVSLGSRTLTTPNVIGLDRSEAVAALDNLGVSNQFLTPQYSDVASVGTIINQSPPPGEPIALGEPVELVTSAGPLNRAVEMPHIEGMTYADALPIINENRLVLRRVSYNYVTGIDEVIVASQFPIAGSQVMPGSEILLTLQAPTSSEVIGERNARVVVNVPESAGTVRVRITVTDRYETREAYSTEHTGPTTVEQLITSYGRTTVRIMFDNQIIREETF